MGSLDVVNAAVNLAYIPENQARDLEFHPEYFIKKNHEEMTGLSDET